MFISRKKIGLEAQVLLLLATRQGIKPFKYRFKC